MATIDSKPDTLPMILTEAMREHLQTDHLWTAEDLFHFQNPPWQHELIQGVLYRMPPTGFDHGRIESLFSAFLTIHVSKHHLGRVASGDPGFIIARNPDTVIAPDVAYVSNERLKSAISTDRFLTIAPDLVAEIVSPNDRPREVQEKVERWLQFGVVAVVVIDPKSQTVTVHQSLDQKTIYELHDTVDLNFVVPEFSLPIKHLFP
jgi:Uma2 family endonuclease